MNIKKLLIRVLCVYNCIQWMAMSHAWSETYHQVRATPAKKLIEQYQRTDIPPFNELLISWNGIRPETLYTISAKFRVKHNQQWSDWHSLAQWGSQQGVEMQKTDAKDGVRLIVPANMQADGFVVLVSAQKPTIMPSCITVNTIQNDAFTPDTVQAITDESLLSIMIHRLPLGILTHEQLNYAAPQQLSTIAQYIMQTPVNLKELAGQVYDSTTKRYDISSFLAAGIYPWVAKKYGAYAEHITDFKQLHTYLRKGVPIVVYLEMTPDRRSKVAKEQIVSILGYDAPNKRVYFQDPLNIKNNGMQTYALADFLKAWERAKRLACVIKKLDQF